MSRTGAHARDEDPKNRECWSHPTAEQHAVPTAEQPSRQLQHSTDLRKPAWEIRNYRLVFLPSDITLPPPDPPPPTQPPPDPALVDTSDILIPDGYPTPLEVVEMYNLILSRFESEHAEHITPFSPSIGMYPRTKGACSHLRDTIYGCLVDSLPFIEAHIYANNPGTRYCLYCARNEKRNQKYICNLCGHSKFTESKFHRRTAVDFLRINQSPLTFHIGVCDYCLPILTRYRVRKLVPAVPPGPIA